ncbi:hypothetical protein CBP05_18825 [Pseudomonas putida]|nr:hypothetical protein CBP05_18825 [Pseudomonas putida]OUS84943.1 hypothetical protein CBP06_19510 [Pseudomonas putida]
MRWGSWMRDTCTGPFAGKPAPTLVGGTPVGIHPLVMHRAAIHPWVMHRVAIHRLVMHQEVIHRLVIPL